MDGEMAMLHLLRHRFPEDALLGRKHAVGIALQSAKFLALRDFARVNRPLHGSPEAIEIHPGSRWNLSCRLPYDLTSH